MKERQVAIISNNRLIQDRFENVISIDGDFRDVLLKAVSYTHLTLPTTPYV